MRCYIVSPRAASIGIPLCYRFKGGTSPTKSWLGRSTLYRDIQARDHA